MKVVLKPQAKVATVAPRANCCNGQVTAER